MTVQFLEGYLAPHPLEVCPQTNILRSPLLGVGSGQIRSRKFFAYYNFGQNRGTALRLRIVSLCLSRRGRDASVNMQHAYFGHDVTLS